MHLGIPRLGPHSYGFHPIKIGTEVNMKLTSGMLISIALLGGTVFAALVEAAAWLAKLQPLFATLAGGK